MEQTDLPTLLTQLGDDRTQDTAESALQALGPSVVPQLLAIRRDGPARLRRPALHALTHLGAGAELTGRDRAAVERLVRIKLGRDTLARDDRFLDANWPEIWIAVRAAPDLTPLFDVLGLHDPVPATLAMGMTALVADRSHDTYASGGTSGPTRTFVTPEIDGWRLVLGPAVNGLMYEDPGPHRLERLSELFGEVHYYASGSYDECDQAWAVAENGRLVRRYHFYGDPVWSGDPLPWEDVPQEGDDDWQYTRDTPGASLQDHARDVAELRTVDPETIEDDTPRTGHGWLAVDAPGVGHWSFPGALTI
ncbi:hypothetical protein [Kitasatospora camelliae]|uniref:HEAT repeat protein n=1 Tax=Kitasatospora camelliae TaxID=3156397 RepID=A0AAU8K6J8_9ACTN